jgi:hypothetical protein
MSEIRNDLPKSTPRWIRSLVVILESDANRLEREKGRISKRLAKVEEDFHDVIDLIRRIADDKEPSVIHACREMTNRFNAGLYEDEDGNFTG